MLSSREVLSKDDEPSTSSNPAEHVMEQPPTLPEKPVIAAALKLIGRRIRVRRGRTPSPTSSPHLPVASLAPSENFPAVHLQVRVHGGRQLSGDFHCFDRQGNIILSNAYEQREVRQAHTQYM